MANKRLTEQAYVKGLEQGYALCQSQYEEILRDIGVDLDLIKCTTCSHYKMFLCGPGNKVRCCELPECTYK